MISHSEFVSAEGVVTDASCILLALMFNPSFAARISWDWFSVFR